jgi:hypothetical protein
MRARRRDVRHDLDAICVSTLAVELSATLSADEEYRRTGVNRTLDSPDGRLDAIGGIDLGTIIPLGLLAGAVLTGTRFRTLSAAASCAVLTGSLAMRIGVIGSGGASASRPDISLRFTQPR